MGHSHSNAEENGVGWRYGIFWPFVLLSDSIDLLHPDFHPKRVGWVFLMISICALVLSAPMDVLVYYRYGDSPTALHVAAATGVAVYLFPFLFLYLLIYGLTASMTLPMEWEWRTMWRFATRIGMVLAHPIMVLETFAYHYFGLEDYCGEEWKIYKKKILWGDLVAPSIAGTLPILVWLGIYVLGDYPLEALLLLVPLGAVYLITGVFAVRGWQKYQDAVDIGD